jgi:hypothetical protein
MKLWLFSKMSTVYSSIISWDSYNLIMCSLILSLFNDIDSNWYCNNLGCMFSILNTGSIIFIYEFVALGTYEYILIKESESKNGYDEIDVIFLFKLMILTCCIIRLKNVSVYSSYLSYDYIVCSYCLFLNRDVSYVCLKPSLMKSIKLII